MEHHASDTETSYNRVAATYVTQFSDELSHKPFDRHLLRWFSERIADRGVVCDLGCGPGHVAHFIHSHGVPVYGLDLASEMVAQAQHLYPDIHFVQGNMRRLDAADASLGGIIAFYSLIHIPRVDIVAVLSELQRVICPDGVILIAFHIGNDVVHLDEWLGHNVTLDFVFFTVVEMQEYLIASGFEIEVVVERAPYERVEYPSRRAYICACKPHQLPM